MESSSMLERLLTERVGWTVGLAVLVLVVVGRSKTVRARRPLVRRAWEKVPLVRPRVVPPLAIQHLPTALHRRPRWWEKGFALMGTAILSVVMGAMVALVLGAGAVWAVTMLTSRLK